MVSTQQNHSQSDDPPYIILTIDDHYHVVVDADSLPRINKFEWHIYKYHKSYYAKAPITRFNTPIFLCMHRLIASTPPHMVCHHRNRNTLDNRRKNLLNLSPAQHKNLHKNNRLLIITAKTGPAPIPLDKFFSLD